MEMQNMKRIITIQHPQSIHHTNKMIGSWTDWDLSEKGIKQAEAIANNLYEELSGETIIIYSSDLLRTKHTAQIIGKRFDLTPIYKFELRERNLGKCCGKSVEWLKANIEKQEITIDDKCFSDAESRRDAYNRLKPFFEEIIHGSDQNIIIVSHGDLLVLFNTLFLNLDVEVINQFEL